MTYNWVILFTGFTVMFLSGGSRFAFGLVLKPMSEDLGWSRSTLSLAVMVFMMAAAVGLPVAGRLVDRYSLKWTMVGGAVLAALGIGLMAVVQSPWHLFMVYGLLYGFASAGIGNPTVGVMISRWFDRGRGIATSVAVSGNSLGTLVIIVLLTAALNSMGWRAAYLALGVANLLIMAPLVVFAVRSHPSPTATARPSDRSDGSETSEPVQPISAILRSNPFLMLVGIYIICGFQDFLVAIHIVAFAQDQGVGSVLSGNLLAVLGVMGFLGVLVAGWMSDTSGPGKPTLLCFVIRICTFTLISVYQSATGIILFAALYGFTFFITAPLTVIFGGKIFGPVRLGTVAGLISAVHMVAGGMGALAGAAIFDKLGSYNGAFVLMLAMSVIGVAITLMVREHRWTFVPKPV